ncbi:feather beta keratin-like [Melanerpes formicivorus]|uniref:feather beta keratin-like n=1 Tax=Melanerpes formicivorus TaxID=211600 RepID=UPI00358FA87F
MVSDLTHSCLYHLYQGSHTCLSSAPGSSPAPAMSCYRPCQPCQPCGPTPLANSCNEPCVRQCQDSTVVIEPPAVLVTLPGPILSSFPQSTAVGSSTSAAVGSILSSQGVPISSGGFGLSGLSALGRSCLPC